MKKQKKGRAKYKFITGRDIVVRQGLITGSSFRSKWLEIEPDGTLIIYANENGYAWDGCSPKFLFMDLLIGTPDGALLEKTRVPITWFASLVHDSIYQYKKTVPVTRKEADRLFYLMLKDEGFKLARVYYFFVRIGGGFLGTWLNK